MFEASVLCKRPDGLTDSMVRRNKPLTYVWRHGCMHHCRILFLTQHPGRNLLFLEKSPNTIFCHILMHSSLLLSKHMAYLKILLMIFSKFLLENLFSFWLSSRTLISLSKDLCHHSKLQLYSSSGQFPCSRPLGLLSLYQSSVNNFLMCVTLGNLVPRVLKNNNF